MEPLASTGTGDPLVRARGIQPDVVLYAAEVDGAGLLGPIRVPPWLRDGLDFGEGGVRDRRDRVEALDGGHVHRLREEAHVVPIRVGRVGSTAASFVDWLRVLFGL